MTRREPSGGAPVAAVSPNQAWVSASPSPATTASAPTVVIQPRPGAPARCATSTARLINASPGVARPQPLLRPTSTRAARPTSITGASRARARRADPRQPRAQSRPNMP